MAVNVKLKIDGTTYADVKEIIVEKSIGDYNANSNFKIDFNNHTGIYDDTFNLNDEVTIYADKDTAATTKIFTGIIENISYSGSVGKETITLVGRDYGAVLMDMNIQPIVFKSRDVGEIAKVVIEQNAVGIVTTNNVGTTTGTTAEKLAFNHKNIFDALQYLAELAGYYFYVDADKDVHFEVKSGISSGLTFDNTNVTAAKFKTDDKEVFNKIWVYGDRILTGATDTFATEGGAVTGSVFTLTDKPHNIRVTSHDVLQEIGGIYEMDDPSIKANLKYVVNFSEKDIIFVSGTVAGDNIPVSGTLPISVDYERSAPILKFKQDDTSITDYGPKAKIITDRDIKDYTQANEKATAFLAEHKDPKIQGDLNVKGVLVITPGNTAVVNLPWNNINTQTYTMINASYTFNKRNNLSENILRLTMNKKIMDFVDTMKDQKLRMKTVETGPLEGTMTRLETAVDTVPIDTHYEAWTHDIGSNFVLHSTKHGKFHNSDSRVGYSYAGSDLQASGGY